ncbi:MAG TPA: hypothetical protein PLR84_08320 [Chitinophagales bacterium]|nr:hypothetical protein [Chitinophagales bacterium]
MFRLFQLSILSIVFILHFSCTKVEDPTNDNPDVVSVQIDSTLSSFYPAAGPGFESIFSFTIPNTTSFDIDLYWYPTTPHGIYLHFNNLNGDVLIDNNGCILAFDSGIKIDSTLAGNWSDTTDGAFAYDYVSNPSANKGNLAGKGDKYIVFRTFSNIEPHLKYYAWMRVRVSENGRSVQVLSIAYQKNPNICLRTGEL